MEEPGRQSMTLPSAKKDSRFWPGWQGNCPGAFWCMLIWASAFDIRMMRVAEIGGSVTLVSWSRERLLAARKSTSARTCHKRSVASLLQSRRNRRLGEECMIPTRQTTLGVVLVHGALWHGFRPILQRGASRLDEKRVGNSGSSPKLDVPEKLYAIPFGGFRRRQSVASLNEIGRWRFFYNKAFARAYAKSGDGLWRPGDHMNSVRSPRSYVISRHVEFALTILNGHQQHIVALA